jgi:hypothetical protein
MDAGVIIGGIALALIFFAALSMAWAYVRDRARRKNRGVLTRWPIPQISVSELDPIFAPGPLGPRVDSEAVLIAGTDLLKVVGSTSDVEAWILAVLSKRAKLMFEFGTASGRTAYLWARNSPPDARVVTLTLREEDLLEYTREPGDAAFDVENARTESRFTTFYYSGTPVESKVTQLYGDSKAFDESPWAGQCDLVFVDGSHALSYVQSDSRKALRLVKPGGVVLWHDYRGPRLPGVFAGLNELARELPLRLVAGTSLVVYRKP